MSNESMFNASEIEAMKASGAPVSKVISYAAKRESSSINVVDANTAPIGGGWGISPEVKRIGQNKVVTPRVRNEDGSINNQSLVRQPDLDRHNADDVARKKAFREAELERQEHLQLISPESLKGQLEAQNRIIKKLEKRLKALEQTNTEETNQ